MATSKLKADFSNLQTGARVTPGAPLFAQIEVDGGASAALAKEKKKKVVSKKPEAFVEYGWRRHGGVAVGARRGEDRGRVASSG